MTQNVCGLWELSEATHGQSSRETGTSVLQPQGMEFGRQLHPRVTRNEHGLAATLNWVL